MSDAWPPNEEVRADPYDFYAELREMTGFRTYRDVHPGIDFVLVARWRDVDAIVRRPEIFRQHVVGIPEWDDVLARPYPDAPGGSLEPQPLPLSDGEDHRIKRRWHRPLVRRDRLGESRAWIEATIDELLEPLVGRGPVDFRRAFADLLPIRVISGLLDLPEEDGHRLLDWARAFSAIQNDPTASPDERAAGRQAIQERHEYALALLRSRRDHPGDDFVSELVRAQVDLDDGIFDANYLVKQVDNLLHAGHHTTAAMLANAMVDLCVRPRLASTLRNEPHRIPDFLEESMRLNTVIPWTMRMCTERTLVNGTTIPAGAVVWLTWGAANRDPAVFAEPDEFRLDRPRIATNHLTFGRGIHHCLGAPLARLEGSLAFKQLLALTSNAHLDHDATDLTPVPSMMSSRGPSRLVVELVP